MAITHAFVSAIGDGADATLVRPSNWNAAHTDTGVTSGSYVGDDTVNRVIPHGVGAIPKIVFICKADRNYQINVTSGVIYTLTGNAYLAVTVPTSTNFYVGNATSYDNSANYNLITYYWVAIG